VKVLDPGGKEVDNKDDHYVNGDHTTLSVTVPPNLKDGVYTVSTKMLSETDGHVTENAFVVGIGKAAIPSNVPHGSSNQPSQLYIPEAIARFPSLVSQVMIVGMTFATLWLWRPVSRISWLQENIKQIREKINKRLALIMIIGSAILIASDFGMIYAEAKSIGVGIAEAIATKFGAVWIARLTTSFVLLGLSAIMFINQRKMERSSSSNSSRSILQKGVIAGLLIVGLVALITTSLIGHGAATNPPSIPITIDFIHNLAASLWIGGVIYLAFVVVPILKRTQGEQFVKASVLSILIPRFSAIPTVILGVIVITGPFLLYILEPNLALTLASLYGKALIVKLVLAAAMIGIGAYNQMIIHRDTLKMIVVVASTSTTSGEISKSKKITQSNKSIEHSPFGINQVTSKFAKTTKAEALVGIALLAAVAVLVNTGLPASEFQNQLQQVQQQQQQNLANTVLNQQQQGFSSTNFVENNDRVSLSINPYAPGNNNFRISYADSKGNPVDIKSVTLRYTQTEKGIGPIIVDANKVSKGVFSVNAAFGIAGPWNLQVEAAQAKANALDIVTEYNLFVKPKLDDFSFSISDYKISDNNNNAQPLFPLYDKSRNAIWTGDTSINSGRILEFNLNTKKYAEHKIPGTDIITLMTLDPKNNDIWFIDPLNKELGHYNPKTSATQLYKISIQGTPSGIDIDSNSTNIWLTLASANEVLRFNTQSKSFSSPLKLPSDNASPLGITIDQSGQIWIAESESGKLANIDPTKNYKISEYAPTGGQNNTLKSPTALLADPNTGNIYISEHDGHAVSVFNPILKSFRQYPPLNPNGLPFGMTLDNDNRNLWVAEHTINKIAVIDPRTGENKEVNIPQQAPFVQWITSDSQGNIWLAEQRANSLAVITSTTKPSLSNSMANQATTNNNNNNNQVNIPALPFSFADIVGPSVAAGIIVSALFYAKTVIDLKQSERQVRKNGIKKSQS
jgi:copper transport protein